MSQAIASQNSVSSLTGLLVPLADRTLLLPNVAVAELIPYRPPHVTPGLPSWFLGQVAEYLRSGIEMPDPHLEEQKNVVLEHYDLALQMYGEDRGLRLMRKHLSWYTKGFKNGNKYRQEINRNASALEVIALTKQFYNLCIAEGDLGLNPHLMADAVDTCDEESYAA